MKQESMKNTGSKNTEDVLTKLHDRDSEQYDDIIDLPHPTSSRHPRMSMMSRAAQFAPFAALSGYEEAIEQEAINNL